jgi:putative salt-induced outer membrane protein
MSNKWIVFVCLFLLAWAGTASAADEKPAKALSDQAELSYVQTAGNTKTQTLAAKNLLKYKFSDPLTGSWFVGAMFSKDKGATTSENYSTELRLDYAFTERIYSYALAGWNKNRFAGLDQRYYGGLGAGYKLLLGPAHFLLCEAGLNETKEDYTDNTSKTFLTGRAFGKYEYAFSPKSRFSQTAEYLHDFADSKHYKVISETALTASLTDILSMKTSYLVKYDHEPIPAGLKQTDTVLAAALVLNY